MATPASPGQLLVHATFDPTHYVTMPTSVRSRIEACLRDHVGQVVTRKQLEAVAAGAENWHQRLSELRTDRGYTILSQRDRPGVLAPGEYLLASLERRATAGKRTAPTTATWQQVLTAAGGACEWSEDGALCGLHNGAVDPVGGGTVRLTADHRTPHSVDPAADPTDPSRWAALCGRHQVMKRNYWDSSTGKVNLDALVQAASEADKRRIFHMLQEMLGEPVTA